MKILNTLEEEQFIKDDVLKIDFSKKETIYLNGNLKETNLVSFSKFKEFGANKPIKSLIVTKHAGIFEPIQKNLEIVYKFKD